MPKRKHLITALILLVLAGVAAMRLRFLFVGDCDLPDASQVVAMKATAGGMLPGEVIDVPPSHFASILAALRPCGRDSDAHMWAALGDLDLTLKGGSHFRISLYETMGKEGAFSAGPTFESRVYHRGGTDKGIKDAILAARSP